MLVVLGLIFGYGTRWFLNGLSLAEQQTTANAANFSSIINNPLWLPYKLSLYVWSAIGATGASFRFMSGFFAILAIVSFYSLCRRWYGNRVSVLTTILFTLSSTTLTLGRIATPAIMLYGWLFYVAILSWFLKSKYVRLSALTMLVATVMVLYIPGSVWLVGIMLLWYFKDLAKLLKSLQLKYIFMGIVLGMILLTPLAYAIYKEHAIIRDWLLLPKKIELRTMLSSLKNIPLVFFYKSNIDPAYNLGKLPLFDAFSGTMLMLGIYSYRHKFSLKRTFVYILAMLLGTFLSLINNNQLYLFLILPFLYLLIGQGIALLLSEWHRIFPKNPIAKFIGTLLISAGVFSVSFYHLNRYFLAWNNAPETKSIYNKPPLKTK